MNRKKILVLLLTLIISSVFYPPEASNAKTLYSENGAKVVGQYEDDENTNIKWENAVAAVTELEDTLRLVTNFLFAFAILNGALCSIITIVKFAGSGTHPMHRRAAILDLLMCAVTTAMLGSTKLIATLILQLAITA